MESPKVLIVDDNPADLEQELRYSVGQAAERVRLGAEQRRLIRELEERDARRRREIATIASIADALSRTGRPKELSDDLVHKIATALGAEGVVLFLLDEARNELVLTWHEGLPQAIVDELALRRLPAAECTMGCPLLIEKNASLDQWPWTPVFRAGGVNPFLAVPVTSQQEVIGCLVALTLTRRVRAFTLEEREFLETIGYLIGNALAARRREQQARDAEKLAAVGELVAGVAHELGNVLAIVGGSVQFLLANMDALAPFRQHLEVIHRNVAGGGPNHQRSPLPRAPESPQPRSYRHRVGPRVCLRAFARGDGQGEGHPLPAVRAKSASGRR